MTRIMDEKLKRTAIAASEFLGDRKGLPGDLTWLYEKYPREVWPGHGNLNELANFWLQRHAMFREFGASLNEGIARFRENGEAPPAFAQWLAPRIRFFLGQLEGHHQIEDQHYFPQFKAAEARLSRGFDILDNDHHIIHEAIEANAEVAGDFFARLGDPEAARRAADRYAEENERLVRLLQRHLDDEEDLIVPMILSRGDIALE